MISTVFGIATSLGIGVMQLNYGLAYMFDVPESLSVQIILTALVVVLATVSVVSGVEKGIRRLSEFNMLLALALMLFILFQGQTLVLLDKVVNNAGDYLSGFVAMSFDTYAFAGEEAQERKMWWTVFFWGWWIAWTPFVGLFLARISRGRTIREFVTGALFIPLAFMMVWMSVLGNSGIELVANQGVTELESRGQDVSVIERQINGEPLPRLTLQVVMENAASFVYQVCPHRMRTPSFLPADDDFYVRLDVFLAEGGTGQDLNGYTRGQVVGDVLSEYERHLHFLALAGEGGQVQAMPGAVGELHKAASQD